MQFRNYAVCMAIALHCAGGCNSDGPPPVSTSTEEAEVKGTVKVRGKAVTNGTVSFHSANIKRATKDVTVAIQKDGTFTAKTVIGHNTVIVDCRELNLPKNFEIRDAAEQFIDIKSGTNDIEINVPPR